MLSNSTYIYKACDMGFFTLKTVKPLVIKGVQIGCMFEVTITCNQKHLCVENKTVNY